jgi:hypothetical protein
MKRGLILLISVMLLSACAPNLSDERISSDFAGAMADCAKAPDNMKQDCYFRISQVLNTTSPDKALQACSAIENPNPRSSCYNDLINAQTDVNVKADLCTKVDSNTKKGCLDQVVPQITDTAKAIALCNAVTDDVNFKEHCLNQIGGTDVDSKIALCNARTSSNDKDGCLMQLGQSLFETQPAKAVEICNKVSDKNNRNGCLNFFIGSPELIKSNPTLAISICDSFNLKDNCYMNIAQTISITNPEMAVSVCKKLSDEIQTANCFGMVWFGFDSRVIQNFDFSMNLCKSLNLKKDDCYRRIAGIMMNVDKNKAAEACNAISPTNSPGCLQEIRR